VGQRLMESSVILGVLLSLPLSFAASTALRVLGGGEEFLGATDALQVQAWVLLSVFVVQACIVLLIALHQHRAIVYANVIGLVCVVVAGAVFLSAYGVVGGAIAVVGADIVLMLVILGFLLTGDFRGELQLGAIPRILLATLLAIAAGLATPGGDVLAAAVATTVFCILLLVLRAAPPEARELLRRALPLPLR
jgi:O-antigen/teichoic acid export membrane protein